MCPQYYAILHLEDYIYTSGKFAQFQGHLLAVWLKCKVVSRVSFPDLFLDNCHLNVSLVQCCITFGRLHIHKWKVCTISRPFTCRLTQMYFYISYTPGFATHACNFPFLCLFVIGSFLKKISLRFVFISSIWIFVPNLAPDGVFLLRWIPRSIYNSGHLPYLIL